MVEKKLKYYLERKDAVEQHLRSGQFVDAERGSEVEGRDGC